MATSVVEIWNMALSAAGSRGSVATDTENSREANLCRLWYDLVRDVVQKSASWPSTKTYAKLTVLASRTQGDDWDAADPAPKWSYAYTLPTDMLQPVYLTNFARFELALQGSTPALMTNQKDAVLHYLIRQSTVANWDTSLTSAIVHALAAKIAVPLGSSAAQYDRLKQEAEGIILSSQTDIANEQTDTWERLPDFIQDRGYDQIPSNTKYMYPYEVLSGVLN